MILFELLLLIVVGEEGSLLPLCEEEGSTRMGLGLEEGAAETTKGVAAVI